jgi:hypothetical protein
MDSFSVNKWDSLITTSKSTMDSGVEETDDKVMKMYVEKTNKVIARVSEIGLPKKNEQLRLVTKRSFNSVAFIKHICENETIEDAVFVVYSINFEAAKIINDLIESGKIKKATILISNLRNKAHRKKEQLTKDLFIDNPNIRLIFASSHAKIIATKTKSNHYVIEGSGNLSYNSRIEQYTIDNSEQVYRFTKEWIDEICEYLKGKKELIIYD